MKIDELMIGDWLLYKSDSLDNAFPIQVTREMFNKELVVWKDRFEPITLTPEILEKNGFKVEFYNDYKVYELNNFKVCKNCCNYFEVCDLWDDSDWGWRIINFCPCIYVHQLQHALKLCGIDKEIVV